jgi:hypothetical protein
MKAIFEIVNEDYELVAIPNSGGIGNPGSFKINKVVSTKVKTENGKGVLLSELKWEGPPGGCTMPGFTHISVNGPISITASSQKCTAEEGKPIFLKLDMGNCIGMFASNGPYASVPCSCTIMIKNAGQTKVKGS